jgi:hypothetical protein
MLHCQGNARGTLVYAKRIRTELEHHGHVAQRDISPFVVADFDDVEVADR